MHELNRRDLGKLALAALAALPAFAKGRPNLRFPKAPRERLSVASYAFRALYTAPGLSSAEASKRRDFKLFAADVVERLGIHNVEPLGRQFPSTESGYLHDYRRAVKKAGAMIVNIPVNVGASPYDPDAANRKSFIDVSKKWVDNAHALGSPGVRIHIQRAGAAAPEPELTAASLRPVVDYAASRDIIVTLENDDLASEDAFFLVKVIERVNSPYLRALPDFCNSMLSGNEQFNYDAVKAMFEHAYEIAHVKDVEAVRGKIYRIDLAKTFAIAKAAGYRGYYSIEFEGEGDPWEGSRKLIEASLRYIS